MITEIGSTTNSINALVTWSNDPQKYFLTVEMDENGYEYINKKIRPKNVFGFDFLNLIWEKACSLIGFSSLETVYELTKHVVKNSKNPEIPNALRILQEKVNTFNNRWYRLFTIDAPTYIQISSQQSSSPPPTCAGIINKMPGGKTFNRCCLIAPLKGLWALSNFRTLLSENSDNELAKNLIELFKILDTTQLDINPSSLSTEIPPISNIVNILNREGEIRNINLNGEHQNDTTEIANLIFELIQQDATGHTKPLFQYIESTHRHDSPCDLSIPVIDNKQPIPANICVSYIPAGNNPWKLEDDFVTGVKIQQQVTEDEVFSKSPEAKEEFLKSLHNNTVSYIQTKRLHNSVPKVFFLQIARFEQSIQTQIPKFQKETPLEKKICIDTYFTDTSLSDIPEEQKLEIAIEVEKNTFINKFVDASLSNLPEEQKLRIAINAAQDEAANPRKRTNKVKIPYILKPRLNDVSLSEHIYQLKAVIIHEGDAGAGHYYTYVPNTASKVDATGMPTKWIEHNDEKATPVSYAQIKKNIKINGYLLLYDLFI